MWITIIEAIEALLPKLEVTEYVVVFNGFTVILAVVSPVFQTYDDPPVASKTVVSPLQISVSEPASIIKPVVLDGTILLTNITLECAGIFIDVWCNVPSKSYQSPVNASVLVDAVSL